MNSNLSESIKNTELFMMAQFIDIMDVIDGYKNIEEVKEDIKNRKRTYQNYIKEMIESKNFLSLTLYNENIDTKIENCSEIYSTSIEYQTALNKLETKYENLLKKLEYIEQKELEEIKGLIYELCDFDAHLAYKIGLIEGMKRKNKCT